MQVVLTRFARPAAALSAAAALFGVLSGCAGQREDLAKQQQTFIEEIRKTEAEQQQGMRQDPRPNHLALARNLVEGGFYEVALVQLETAQEDEGQNPEVHYLMGVCHLESKRPEAAVAAFKKALARDDKYAPAHNGLGRALEQQGRKKAAIQAFKKAVSLDPARADFNNDLGYALLLAGRYEAAEEHLLRSLDLDPAYRIARNNLAICYGYQGREGDALQVLLRDYPPPVAYRNMAAVYRLMGRPDKAGEMTEAAEGLEHRAVEKAAPEVRPEKIEEQEWMRTAPEFAADASGNASTRVQPAPPEKNYAVQVGAFLVAQNARKRVARLKAEGYAAYIHEVDRGGRQWFLARIGDYGELALAREAAAAYHRRTGGPAVITRFDSADVVVGMP
jgi:Flp pilus assembly protein TadD